MSRVKRFSPWKCYQYKNKGYFGISIPRGESEMRLLHIPKLTDGVISLRPLNPEDAADHLAGEDEEMAKWVSGGRSTLVTVEAFIRNNQESWRSGGPRRAFGVFDCASNRLSGFIEVNLARVVEPGQVNVSYGVFPQWRRQGLALRAINLMDEYLRTATDARQVVLRIVPENIASLKLAEKAGFTFCGLFDEPEGRMARYVRDI
jgi:RimJ/RimL family protein N-acetyltransferase